MEHGTWTAARLRIALLILALAALSTPAHADEYASSVVGTDFDFIRDSDPSAFMCLEYKARGTREMPDKRGPTPLFQEAFIFMSYFTDGTSVDIAIDIDFETKERAREEALRYAPRLGKLPTSLRRGVKRVVVHEGGKNTTAFSDMGLIVLYSENATKRISTHDLEETIFHESVHASWDKHHARSKAWREAQTADGTFITRYAKNNPVGEDLAESALFAYTLIHHPERIPSAEAAKIKRAIPARIAFVKTLVPPTEPIFYQVAPKYACDGSGKTFTVVSSESDECDVDITSVGTVSDILSNALMRGLDQDASVVTPFLSRAIDKWSTVDEMLEATVTKFGFDRSTLDAQVEKFLHCNCDHGDLTDSAAVSSDPVRAAAVETPAAATQVSPNDVDSEPIRPILYVIAALLLALLVVNSITLVVLLRQSKAKAGG